MKIQQQVAKSKNPVERCFGSLLLAGMFERHLAQLTDRQIGQLMFDLVGGDLPISQMEVTICHQATLRLFRSAGGRLTAEELAAQQECPSCPICGNEMPLHYGIGGRDFRQCTSLGCKHKEYLPRNSITTKEQR